MSKNTITLSPSYFFLLFENGTLMKKAKEISFNRGNCHEKILYYPAGTNRKKTAKFFIQNRRHRPFALHSLLHFVVCANGTPDFGRSQGILWVVLFGLAKTFQYGGLSIIGVEGVKRLKSFFKKAS